MSNILEIVMVNQWLKNESKEFNDLFTKNFNETLKSIKSPCVRVKPSAIYFNTQEQIKKGLK